MPKTYPTKKPYDGYPLTPRADGRFQKKIRRKLHYFGQNGDHEAALREYLEVRDDLHAGRQPRRKGDIGPTVADLLNRYLQAKQRQRDNHELSPRTFYQCHRYCKQVAKVFGPSRLIADLHADDFAKLRADFATTLGPSAMSTAVQHVRSIFKFGYDSNLYDHPVKYGPEFRSTPKRVLRKHRATNGKKLFTAEEIRRLLDAASPPMKACILLGINCGYGNTDCSELPLAAIDFNTGMITFPRPKTGVDRRCPLWPETADAIKKALDTRPIARSLEDADQVFLSPTGLRLVHLGKSGNAGDSLAVEFKALCKKVGISGQKKTFYALRHTHRTIADEVRDGPAIDLIMGHTDNTMGGVYRERIDDSRLLAVVDHVHDWLFTEKENK